MYLFGGDQEWSQDDWTASDDRVRGGKSQSYFEKTGSAGRFYGDLDIKTLGGAGFASQRTTNDDRNWDLSKYDGLLLKVDKADGKRYTLILKDTLLSRNPDNGREQATISYEYDFDTSSSKANSNHASTTFVPWTEFKPTYRGKEKKDAAKLDTSSVKRVSIMMRSFFGTQEGPFSVTVRSIEAVTKPSEARFTANGGDIEKALSSDSLSGPSTSATSPLLIGCATIVTFFALFVVYRRFVPAK